LEKIKSWKNREGDFSWKFEGKFAETNSWASGGGGGIIQKNITL